VLNDIQIEIAEIVSGVAAEAGFALAGGGALVALGVVDRVTRDLDFFTEQAGLVNSVADEVERALRQRGFGVERPLDAAGFVRLEVSRGAAVCEVDLGHDARRWPVQQLAVGPTVALEELAADKTLALLGRAAPRDFVDVQALAELFGTDRLCELAADKDLGFSRRHLADALDKIDRIGRDRFEVDEHKYQEIRTWAFRWRGVLLEQARQIEREQGIRPDRGISGPDIGL
jgi:hypothetical protein